MSHAPTLYFVPRSRSTRPRWVLEELGLPYNLIRLDPTKGETRTSEHLERHPLGHVPVLETEQGRLFESAALCLQLADGAGDQLTFPLGSYERGLVYQWAFFAMTEIEPVALELSKAKGNAEAAAVAIETMGKRLVPVENLLAKSDYLVGGRFSVADIIVGSVTSWVERLGGLFGLPNVSAYNERLTSREAFKRSTK